MRSPQPQLLDVTRSWCSRTVALRALLRWLGCRACLTGFTTRTGSSWGPALRVLSNRISWVGPGSDFCPSLVRGSSVGRDRVLLDYLSALPSRLAAPSDLVLYPQLICIYLWVEGLDNPVPISHTLSPFISFLPARSESTTGFEGTRISASIGRLVECLRLVGSPSNVPSFPSIPFSFLLPHPCPILRSNAIRVRSRNRSSSVF